MNKVEEISRDFEADYYDELQRRFKVEEENEKLREALVNVCLKLGDK